MELELFFTMAWATMFILIINQVKFFHPIGIPKWLVMLAFFTKVLAGTALYLIYSRYYPDRQTADIFKYFDDSKIMYGALATQPIDYLKMLFGIGNNNAHFNEYYQQMNNWCSIYPTNIYGDGHLMIRFNAFLRLFSFGIYNVHTVFICMFSFTGLMSLYRFLMAHLSRYRLAVFLGVFFIPSVLFWGSGVLKEGLILFALGTSLWCFYLIKEKKFNFWSWIIFLFSLMLLRYLKFYLFIFLVPLLIGYFWIEKTGGRKVVLKYVFTFGLVCITGFLFRYFNSTYDVLAMLSRKQQDFLNVAIQSNSGSLLSIKPLSPNIGAIITGLMTGFITCFARPHIFESHSIVMILAAIENLMFLFALIYAIINLRKQPLSPLLFWFSVIFTIAVFSLCGLLCPVSGALVRYKVPALPFLFIAILSMSHWKIPFQKKKS